MQQSISPLQTMDIDSIMQIEQRAHLHPWSRSLMRSNFGGLYFNFGVFEDDQLRGYCIVRVVAAEAELINIAVDPNHQARALGTCLMQHMCECAMQQQWVKIDLEVRQSNLSAQNLYKKFGFDCIGERANYYPCSNGREHAMLFQRYLEA